METYELILEATLDSRLDEKTLRNELVLALHNLDTDFSMFDNVNDDLRVIDYDKITLTPRKDKNNLYVFTYREEFVTAIKAAIAGNLIDLGIGHKLDIKSNLDNLFEDQFAVDDYKVFKNLLVSGRKKIGSNKCYPICFIIS